jgi:hypothetical protein
MRTLDPLVLKRQISAIQERLLKLVRSKNMKVLYPGPSYPEAGERMRERLFAAR